MLAKIKKSRIPITASVLLLLLILLLNLNKKTFELLLFDTVESINTYDPGYSSLKEFLGLSSLVDLGENNSQIIFGLTKKVVFTGLPKVPELLFSKMARNDSRPQIESLNIDIKFKNFQKILEDRQQGLNDGILINPRSVNARLNYQGKSYPANIRLKGDLPDHWRSNLRMSFRISIKGDESILGMKRFSIHSPGSRQYPHEQAYQDFLSYHNTLTVPHKLLKVSVNGENWGVMNIEEHMSKEYLEKQESKESLIFKFTDEQLWQYQKKNPDYYKNYKLSDPQIYANVYQSDKYLQERVYREQYSYILEAYNQNKISDLISVEPALKAIILSGVWNNQHSLNFANSRFYLNPYTLKLDTITTDQGPISRIDEPYFFVKDLDRFYLDFLKKNVTPRDIGLITNDMFSNRQKLINLYSFHESFFPYDEKTNMNIIESNLKIIRDVDAGFIEALSQNKTSIDDEVILPPTENQLISMPAHIRVQHYDNGQIIVSNLLPIPVIIKSVSNTTSTINLDGLTLAGSLDSIQRSIIQTSFYGIEDHSIQVESITEGITKKAFNDKTLIAGTFNPISEEDENLEKFPFIREIEGGFLIKSGTWNISEPLNLSGDLNIEQGTTLVFENESYLIIKGSVSFMGARDNKIRLIARSGSWKGMYVLGDGSSSIVDHTEFKSTSELRDGILQLTGGVTFYNTDLKLTNSEFIDSNGEDALNIVKSSFEIDNINITGTFSDALDFDFSDGHMKNSFFSNIGGDAVDVSGGSVSFSNLMISDVRDKAVSAGEGSSVDMSNIKIANVGVGIASKDGSQVLVDDITISNSSLFDLMTYSKKKFFNKPSLSLTDKNQNIYSAVRQNGSFLEINNKEVGESFVDVEKLYQTSVMSK